MENVPTNPLLTSASLQSQSEVSAPQLERCFGNIPTSDPFSASLLSPQTPIPTIPTISAASVTSLKPSNAKVAIPRQRSGVPPRISRRVPRACESCRLRNTKCSGDTPVCQQCRELRIHCQYSVGWRERTKKQIDVLSAKSQEFETLLRELGNAVEGPMADRIKLLLEKYSPDAETSSNDRSHSSVTPQDEEVNIASSPSSIGSLEAVDRVSEDFNKTENSRATGYMGKNSEVTWMQKVQKEAEQRARGEPVHEPSPTEVPPGEFTLDTMNYHLDDLDIDVLGPVQMYWIPPRELADRLFEDYLTTVHPFFPIINRPLFTAQYRTFFESDARPGDKWLAILNLIFAISAKHAHLIQAAWRGDEQDHLVYLTRARFLSMNDQVLFSHPDLQQVQVEGLIAFYLLASDQINRAWRITALAIRSAISLGINMKIVDHSTPNVSKEARYRVWWCLYTFEHMLGTMTGRATCILDGFCTCPLPLPFEDEDMRDPAAAQVLNNPLRDERIGAATASSLVRLMSSNPAGSKTADHRDKYRDMTWLRTVPPSSALCFLYFVDLAVVAQEIVNKVYSTESAMVPWSHIENRIGELRSRIELWLSNIPSAYNFTNMECSDPDIVRGRLGLAFHYYSARITLGRPCLCRHDARQTGSGQTETFSHKMAIVTLESAFHMLDLIQDNPNPIYLYQVVPWWCILHYLMQAATVLLLEASFGSIHMPQKEERVLEAAKKAIRWLFAMSEHSIASRRAWQLCDSSLRRMATAMGQDISDMPSYAYEHKPDQPIDIGPPLSSAISQPWNTGIPAADGNLQAFAAYAVPPVSGQASMPLMEAAGQTDAYFPYDSISGEFIRSFFPHPADEDPWGR